MPLKAIHDTIEEIPEEYRDLYSERDGKFELTGIQGVKTEADVDRVAESLRKEKSDHKATKDKLTAWNGLNMSPEQVTEQLDRIPELEAAQGGEVDEAKIAQLVDAKVARKLAPVERERDTLKTRVGELEGEVEGFQAEKRTRVIHDAVRKSAGELKVVPSAIDDVLMLSERVFEIDDAGKVVTKDNVGATPGIDPMAWLTDQRDKRAHWWPTSQGGGAGGAQGGTGADNPWSREGWNITKQGQIVREKGAEHAQKMAAAVGSKVGATAPPSAQK